MFKKGPSSFIKHIGWKTIFLGPSANCNLKCFEHRMKNEYNSDVLMESIGSKIARWVENDKIDESLSSRRSQLVKDRYDKPYFYLKMNLLFDGFKIRIRRLFLAIRWMRKLNKVFKNSAIKACIH